MPKPPGPDTDQLLNRMMQGDSAARQALLERHRRRLRKMVAFRIDRRLAARVDPSDVVQEVLADAAGRLTDYARSRPLPFYPWLRQTRLGAPRRPAPPPRPAGKRPCRARSRTCCNCPTSRPPNWPAGWPTSAAAPASTRCARNWASACGRPWAAAPGDREVLVLRHLEQLSTADAAAVLGISDGAVKVRHLRALQRLRPPPGRGCGGSAMNPSASVSSLGRGPAPRALRTWSRS